MVGRHVPLLALALLLASCGEVTHIAATPTPVPTATPVAATTLTAASATPSGRTLPEPCRADVACGVIQNAIDRIDAGKLNDHLIALTSVGSRDPRNPGHAKAVTYIKEQLGALAYYGWKIESQRTVYQGIPLENIFATLDLRPLAADVAPATAVGPGGWILISAHYDSTANRTAKWRPATDPAPGA